MSIPLSGSGGIFTRLGHIAGLANVVLTSVGTTVPAHIGTIDGDYLAADQSLISGLYPALAAYQGSPSSLLGYLQRLAQSTVIRMAADDAAQPDASLGTALLYLVNQMMGSSDTVKACAIGATPTAGGSNTGNGVLVVSTKLANGLVAENSYAETLTGTITSDAVSGSARPRRERLTLRGLQAAPATLSYNWPLGSGVSNGLTAVDASTYSQGGSANWLNDGDFELTWSGNLPPGWFTSVGTPGTTIAKSVSTVYDGLNSLSFVGDGSELTGVYQTISPGPKPLTQLTVNLWVNTTGTPGAGVLEVALTDGSGSIINDAQGTANSFTRSLVGVSTWTSVSGSFRLPRVLPAAVRLRIRLSTALTNATTVYIDRVAMTQPTQLYVQGYAVALFSGSTNFIQGDTFTLAVTNDRAGGLATCWQSWMDRLMNMRALGLLLPSTSGSPTISSGLIT